MFRRKIRSLAAAGAAFALLTGTGWLIGQGQAEASTPLPPYPATTTLGLGSPNCVTDSVIMNDPLDSTSPITDTYGNAGGILSHATPPVTYSLWWLSPSVTMPWASGPPPGVQINSVTGEVAAYGPGAVALGTPWIHNASAATGTNTYTIRDHGQDSVGAKGTEQYQVQVNSNGSTFTTLTYQGNTFNNATGALTIQLNGGSATSTSLTLSAIASTLHIPGSTPVAFSLFGSNPGWTFNGTTDVLTGVNGTDPEFKVVTSGNGVGFGPYDQVFFTLSGISTTSGGVFFLNSDANPCVTGPPSTPSPSPSPTGTSTSTPPPSAMGNFGDEVNAFGNGFDVFRQHYAAGAIIAGWPANNSDPATLFIRINRGSGVWQFEATRAGGVATGLCVSDPGGGWPDPVPDGLILTPCNTGPWQQFRLLSGEPSQLQDVATGLVVRPDGIGAQLRGSATAIGGTSDHYTWKDNAHLP